MKELDLDKEPPPPTMGASAPKPGDSPPLNAPAKALVELVATWKQRHEEILNDALPGLAKPGDLSRPGDRRWRVLFVQMKRNLLSENVPSLSKHGIMIPPGTHS